MIDADAFREALAQLATAVTIVTTDGPIGRYGMTASAVCSVSDDPATMLLCVNRASKANAHIKGNGRFCVNMLGELQEILSSGFSDRSLSIDQRFALSADWINMSDGLLGLSSALAVIACELENVAEIGTHSVFFGRVTDVYLGLPAGGLVYFSRGYHRLASTEGAFRQGLGT